MTTPYVTPAQLIDAPTGISWSTIPAARVSAQAQLAEQTNICWRATQTVDSYCNQVLRATLDVEQQTGPDYRMTLMNNGTTRLLVSRWPILQLISAQVCATATFPPQWRIIPSNWMRTENEIFNLSGTPVEGGAGSGPSAVLFAPGLIDWKWQRSGYTVQLYYLNGWPHTSLSGSSTVNAGATTLNVDDVTGFTGTTPTIYDGQGTEVVSVASVTATTNSTVPGNPNNLTIPTGPGTLTLSSPTVNNHDAGVVVSNLPWTVQWATILFCVADALTRGATATTVQQQPGAAISGEKSHEDIKTEGEILLNPYRRIL